MYAGKPILGLLGGIGSGKSFVAKLFGEEGCAVIDSDTQVRDAYRDPAVLRDIIGWWGPEVVDPDGVINRGFIAAKVFADTQAKRRLEALIHPLVHAARERQMRVAASSPQVVAYVWDTPLLVEAGLAAQCDAIVFVDAPLALRQKRVQARNNWDVSEHEVREKSQTPLDTKRALADYVISNAVDAKAGSEALADLREQIRRVISQVLASSTRASSARANVDPPMSEG